MGDFQIDTAQNIKINQNIASIGKRAGAKLLDYAVFYMYFMFVFMLFGMFGRNPDIGNMQTIFIIVFVPIVFYTLIFEYYMNGQTPGKRMLKIQVVKTDGSSADFVSYLLRWSIGLLDLRIGGGLIAIIVYLINGKGQRLGDIAADTTVVNLEVARKSKNIFINIDDNYRPTYPHVTLFTDEDISKIKELYIKARRNEDGALLSRLRDKIKEKLEIETEMDDLDFVKTIVKDYYYFYYNNNESSRFE